MTIFNRLIGVALAGSTFLFSGLLNAAVPIVRSQPDHSASSGDAVPLARSTGVQAADQALLESLLFQIQDLQGAVAEQRGLIEELNYQVQILQQEQKERYLDLDRRILAIQEQVSSAPSARPVPATSAISAVALSDEAILAQYNAARDLMRDRNFDQAIADLTAFANQHQQHPLTPSAWFWIGEIYLVQRDNQNAKSAFERIVANYPDNERVPDSLYKLGVIAQQSNQPDRAKEYYERVIADYPNSQSAKLSAARLNSQ